MPISMDCEQCGKSFLVKPSRAEEKRFCSRECKHKNGRVELTCLNCKKTFTEIGYRANAIFCGRRCRAEYSSNKFKCQTCGKEFWRGKAYDGAAKFCSMLCRRTEGCTGTTDCERCGKAFSWTRGKRQVKPRFCSLECRGHTGFTPGGEIRIANLTPEQKLERLKESFEKGVIRQEGCWEWKGPIAKGGYPVMGCRRDCGSDRGHRASWIIHRGPIPNGMHVCHACDNPICTNPEHLWIGTHRQNNDDKIAKGRGNYSKPPHNLGSQNGGSKLKEDQVIEIKKLIQSGRSCYSIGKDFGVSKQTILRIKNGTNWKHITEQTC